MSNVVSKIREYSLPLIVGVFVALLWANVDHHSYHELMEKELFFGVNFHFLVNDIFMVLFFAIAGVEITMSVLPGGALNPVKKAITPLLATIGGVVGPALVYLGLNSVIGSPELAKGWGIPTATDIALAWLVARFVFGAAHPAVKFLLLLAIADDAIGLVIIAIFYPDPLHPVEPTWLLVTLAAMAIAFIFRKMKVKSYWPYLLIPGVLSWVGLHNAHMHPALALVFIVPFLPHPAGKDAHGHGDAHGGHSTLLDFEHGWKAFVDFGLFAFGLANAGVEFSGIGTATWLVFAGLLLGKIVGIVSFGAIATMIGFSLPEGMGKKELFAVSIIAAVGLTVALFVAGAAFVDPGIQGAAKMGALFSGGIAFIAIIVGKMLRIKKINEEVSSPATAVSK